MDSATLTYIRSLAYTVIKHLRQRTAIRAYIAPLVACALTACLPLTGCDTVKTTVNDTIDAVTPAKRPRPEVDRISTEPDIRVRVARQGEEHTLSGPDRFVVRTVDVATGDRSPMLARGPIKISSSEKGVRIVDADGQDRTFGSGVDVEVLASDGTLDGALDEASESIRMDGRALPGFVTLRPLWNENPQRYDVVVTMPLESYLPGVLSKELLRDWPRQSYEAQAVAARTYALFERARSRSAGKQIDVEDTTADQVFGGTGSLVVAVEAARATRGWVLTEDGALIRAYFSSQCGGRPASAESAWTSRSPLPFNRAKALQGEKRQAYCQRGSLYRWSLIRSVDDVTKRIRAWGKSKGSPLAQLGRLRSIDVAERNNADRPSKYTVVGDVSGEVTIAPEELREAINFAVAGLPPIKRENRLHSGDVEVAVTALEVRFSGRGFGHGVGMCQWCIKGMADAGLDWRTMVEQFYPGVDVKKLYN
jgi:stage II sporulation protein D